MLFAKQPYFTILLVVLYGMNELHAKSVHTNEIRGNDSAQESHLRYIITVSQGKTVFHQASYNWDQVCSRQLVVRAIFKRFVSLSAAAVQDLVVEHNRTNEWRRQFS